MCEANVATMIRSFACWKIRSKAWFTTCSDCVQPARSEFVLSTKVGYGVPGISDWTCDCIVAGVDAARDRLRTDVIDIVHLHSCPLATLQNEDVVRALLRYGYGVPYVDANVPYKLVRRSWCERLGAIAPSSPVIPSILLALLLAHDRARVVEQVVAHRERRGGVGSLKPLRLMRFCLRAWRELRAVARALPAPRA